MVTINDIRGKTLERILFYAINDVSLLYSPAEELRKCFSLAWVRREWRRILLWRLYEHAFISIRLAKLSSELLVCKSSIKLIVENGLSKYARRLSITVPEGYITSGYLIELLDGQLFNKTNWPSVNSLRISGDLLSALTNRNQGEHRADNCDATSQYLHTYLPALTSISADHINYNSAIHSLSKFVDLKLHRLSYLNLRKVPIILTHHSFSSSLTYLALRWSPGQTTLPYIYTPNLRTLGLFDIPPSFSWRCFHSESSDSFDFSELESMRLHYSRTSVDLKSATFGHSGAHSHTAAIRKIHMPKIKNLSLSHIPPSDAHLFAPHLLSHLDSFDIVGGIGVLTQMNLRFPYSKRISIFLSDNTVDDIQEYNTFTESIFSSFSAATLVKFEVEHYIPVSINSIGWSNLEELSIIAFISRTTIYYLLSQLPLLKRLRVRYITPDGESCPYDKHHDFLPYLPDDSNFNSKLWYLEYFDGTSRSPLVFDLDPLYEFITNVITLEEVKVPKYYLQEVQDHFNQDSIQRYPHIQYIDFIASFVKFHNQL